MFGLFSTKLSERVNESDQSCHTSSYLFFTLICTETDTVHLILDRWSSSQITDTSCRLSEGNKRFESSHPHLRVSTHVLFFIVGCREDVALLIESENVQPPILFLGWFSPVQSLDAHNDTHVFWKVAPFSSTSRVTHCSQSHAESSRGRATTSQIGAQWTWHQTFEEQSSVETPLGRHCR